MTNVIVRTNMLPLMNENSPLSLAKIVNQILLEEKKRTFTVDKLVWFAVSVWKVHRIKVRAIDPEKAKNTVRELGLQFWFNVLSVFGARG